MTAGHQVAGSGQDDTALLQQGRAILRGKTPDDPNSPRLLIDTADPSQTQLVDLGSIVECQPAAAPRRSVSQANVPAQEGERPHRASSRTIKVHMGISASRCFFPSPPQKGPQEWLNRYCFVAVITSSSNFDHLRILLKLHSFWVHN
ncbi:hypothetical protein ISCGN_001257 [Ixodes scapularis]